MEASDFFVSGYFSNAGDQQNPNNNNFTVDDLLDFSKEDEVMTDAFFDSITANSADSSTVTVVDSCNSSVSGENGHFNGNISCRSFTDAPFPSSELCVPVITLLFTLGGKKLFLNLVSFFRHFRTQIITR